MNRIYKLVWSRAKECYVVASELAKSTTKGTHGAKLTSLVLTKNILLGLSFGVSVLANPLISYALPQGGTGSAGVAINATSSTQLDITGTAANNVIRWQSFDIAGGEKVQFDGGATVGASAKNYLNLINSMSPSKIDGIINGGNNVYLINPNGVIFGAGSSVNVGNLYVSTRNIDDTAINAFKTNGTNPLGGDLSGLKGDIVNLGTMTATNILLEGDNISFINGKDSLTGSVEVKANGEIQVGLQSGKTIAEFDAAHTNVNWNSKERTACKLINDVDDLQNMKDNLADKYMLANNIDASGKSFTPVGDNSTPFTGKLNGMGYEIQNLKIERSSSDYTGLFGYISNAEVKNVGLVGGTITGKNYTGGLAGYATGSTITGHNTANVTGYAYIGGLVGYTDGSIINGYNTGVISGTGYVALPGFNATVLGGLVGCASNESSIYGYNIAKANDEANPAVSSNYECIGGLVGISDSSSVTGYNTANVKGSHETGGLVGWCYKSTISGNNAGKIECGNGSGGVVGSDNGSSTIDVYNTGEVKGAGWFIGGLVGALGVASGSNVTGYNTGNISSTSNQVGGLVGWVAGGSTIIGYNIGNVSSTYTVAKDLFASTGGLVGYIENKLSGETKISGYNIGKVTSKVAFTGGLVGRCAYTGTVTISGYNTGEIYNEATHLGGLVGSIGPLRGSSNYVVKGYNTGKVSCKNNSSIGGLVGEQLGTGKIYGQDISGAAKLIGTGQTPTETWNDDINLDGSSFKSWQVRDHKNGGWVDLYGSSRLNWSSISATGGDGTTWRVYANGALPLLRRYLTPMNISEFGLSAEDSQEVEYDKTKYTIDEIKAVHATDKHIDIYKGSNAGVYHVYSDQTGYDLIGDVTLTIKPKDLPLTSYAGESLTYDGVEHTAIGYTASDLCSGDKIEFTNNTIKEKNAGEYSFSGITYTITDGNHGHNYTVTGFDNTKLGKLTINKATITLTPYAGENLTYDGQEHTATGYTASGLVVGTTDKIEFTNNTIKKTNAGEYALEPTYTVSDGNSGKNYTVTGFDNANLGKLTINKATITLTPYAGESLTYDGQEHTVTGYTASGLVGSDKIEFTNNTIKKTNAGEYALEPTYTVSDGNSGKNYTVTGFDNTKLGKLLINKATITLTGYAGESLTYDGQDHTATGYTASGLVGTDKINFTNNTITEKNAGEYALEPTYTVSDGNSGNNYTVTGYDNGKLGKLLINKATITLTATPVSSEKGKDILTVSGRSTGWVSGEGTEDDVINWTTDANKDKAGKYKIEGALNTESYSEYNMNYKFENAAANATAYTVTSTEPVPPPKPVPPPDPPQKKETPGIGELLRDDSFSDMQKQIVFQTLNEKAKTEITDIDPNIKLPENKGIVNGEQLVEMYQADAGKQDEEK